MRTYQALRREGHGSDALENLLTVLGEEDREAVLSKNAATFFDIPAPDAS
jgi:hypothetical protein